MIPYYSKKPTNKPTHTNIQTNKLKQINKNIVTQSHDKRLSLIKHIFNIWNVFSRFNLKIGWKKVKLGNNLLIKSNKEVDLNADINETSDY